MIVLIICDAGIGLKSRRSSRMMRKLLSKQGFAPDVLVTDKLRSYGAAKSEIGLSARHDQGLHRTMGLRIRDDHVADRSRSGLTIYEAPTLRARGTAT